MVLRVLQGYPHVHPGICYGYARRRKSNFLHREYLVNIDLGRGTAQKRVTGGRWRRIVLGEHLAERMEMLSTVLYIRLEVPGRLGP